MSEQKTISRITIPIDSAFKERLELIAKGQRRSLSANLEHALEVYAALFDAEGKMLVPLDSILMGDLSCLRNVTSTVQNKNEQADHKQSENENKTDETVVNEQKTTDKTASDVSDVLGEGTKNVRSGGFGRR